jgi:branched-chain amino acid transport system substrate-binding protein
MREPRSARLHGHPEGEMKASRVHCRILSLMALLLGSSTFMAADSVKLAIVVAKTGIGADENLPALKATELAVEEINRAGGLLGNSIELVEADTASTPLGAKKAAEYVVQQGVIGVIGAFRSSHCLAMSPVIAAARIPMITPTATNPEVTLGNEFLFRVCCTDEFQGKAAASFAAKNLRASRAVVLANASETYCTALAGYFVTDFTAMGGKVVWTGEYQGNATDFKALLETMKTYNPEVVFLPGYAHDSGLLINQAVGSGIRTVFLGADAWDWGVDQFAGPALEGAFHSTHWYADSALPGNVKLKAKFQKSYGPNGYNDMQIPLTYDAIMLFADAVKRAGTLNPDKIRAALQQTKAFKGAAGSITFDRNRNPVGKDVILMRFQNGAWRYYKSISPGP